MDPEFQQLDVQRRDALVEGIDEKNRTIRVRFSTGARRTTIDWDTWRYVDEELSLQPGHVRLERLKAGAPFLKDHRASVDCQIGAHQDAWLTNGEGWALIRMLTDEDSEKCFQKIIGGARNISVGYRVHVYEITEKDGQRPLYRAVDWEPLENSLVAINADAGAQVRSEPTETARLAPVKLIRSEAMTPEQLALAASQQRFAASMQALSGAQDLQRAEAMLSAAVRIAGAARSATKKEDASEVEGALQALTAARTRATELETENASLRSELDTLRAESSKRELDALVNEGLSSGKLLPAQETWARGLVEEKNGDKTTYKPEGLKQLRAYLEVAVPKGPGNQVRQEPAQGSAEAKEAPIPLTTEDKDVMQRMGLTEEQMRKSKTDLRARGAI